MKKISIALATYNGATYLPELLDSLSRQSLAADEIIAVDDCSKDDTVKILQKYSKKLPIRIIVNESNLGVNKNFEKAVKESKGDYILICDQDDVWFENNIEDKVMCLMKLPQNFPALITSCSIVTDKNLNILQNRSIRRNIDDWKLLITKYFQGTAMAFNRNLVEELYQHWPKTFDEFPYDRFLYLTALASGNVYALNKKLMYYRTHGKNTSFASSGIHNFIKKYFPTYRLYQNRLTVPCINQLNLLLNTYSPRKFIPERKLVFEKLINCRKKNKINWYNFFRIKDIPLFIRIHSFLGSMFFYFKKIF